MLTGSADQAGRYTCWSQEDSFRQLMASYCVGLEERVGRVAQEPVSTSRSTSASAGGSLSALLEGKTYWTEFLVMCMLFGTTVILLTFFMLHHHRTAVKAFLKQGKCTSSHPKKARKSGGLPTESLPINGTVLPSAPVDHKGYQALNDSHVVSTPAHDAPVPGIVAFSESEQRPLSVHESLVEVVAPSQRPRVRLGSEIRDSVV